MKVPRGSVRAVLCASVAAVVASGCGWQGLNSLPLPGVEGTGSDAFLIQAQLPDVDTLKENSRVRVGDVTVGSVARVERQGWHALVTLRINADVDLPANSTAVVGQTSLLGSQHIELSPPAEAPSAARLHDGSLIPLSSTHTYPTTEQTLATVSLLFNGGGLGQIQDITAALARAGYGREDEIRSLIEQVNTFTRSIDGQASDIIAAVESLNHLTEQFAEREPVLDKALRTIPDALRELGDRRAQLVDVVDRVGDFSALANDSLTQTKEAILHELQQLGPTLKSLADAGPALTRSLDGLTTFPWPRSSIDTWMRGDYGNLTLILDMTLSRLDSSLFTGTRWEGDLTELELQWGRTIGQLPSPYTGANPLLVPYNANQGP